MSQSVTSPVGTPVEETPAVAEPRELNGLLAEFQTEEALLSACARVRDAGFTRWDAHTPYPVHGIDRAVGTRPTILPWIVFALGAMGAITGFVLQWWTNAIDFPFVVSGKPLNSLPASIPIIFEMTILFSAFGAVFGMLALNNLPLFNNALFSSKRFRRVTNDRFFITIEAADPRFNEAETRTFLESLSGGSVERLENVGATKPPQWLLHAGLVMVLLSWIPLALAARAWFSTSSEPRFHVVFDMDQQEKFLPQRPHPLFKDGRAMRPPVEGTVSRADEHLRGDDDHFYFGKVNGEWATTLPSRLRNDVPGLLARGKERYTIFCSPCHGADGLGDGPVRLRSDELEMPLNVKAHTEDTVLARELGHLYNTVTNGFNTMPAYGDQIPERDRWAIVTYVRALQRTHTPRDDDVPAETRAELRRRRGANE